MKTLNHPLTYRVLLQMNGDAAVYSFDFSNYEEACKRYEDLLVCDNLDLLTLVIVLKDAYIDDSKT